MTTYTQTQIAPNHNVTGTCGECGGPIISPMIWAGTGPVSEWCQSCGKRPKVPAFPVLGPVREMQPNAAHEPPMSRLRPTSTETQMVNEADETPKGTDTAGRLDGLVGQELPWVGINGYYIPLMPDDKGLAEYEAKICWEPASVPPPGWVLSKDLKTMSCTITIDVPNAVLSGAKHGDK